nr:unnamed protein product [Spirometra erinaceieuropaei]
MAHRQRDVLSKVERDALKELRGNNDHVIVPADKGRSTVVLDRTDYNQKAKSLLDDRQSHVLCESNPMKTLTREINTTLLAMENSFAILPIDGRMTRAQGTTLARFYGLRKVHKEGAPLRPIVSLKGTPTYGLSKCLFQRLKFLTSDSNTTVSSSSQFLEKLKGVRLLPNDIMVSFDVTSFFTSIPQDLANETIEIVLREKNHETKNRLGYAQIIQLLKFCLKTYFTFNGTLYEQVKGTPMGSPISGLIAESVLKRPKSLAFCNHRPKFWARYQTGLGPQSINKHKDAQVTYSVLRFSLGRRTSHVGRVRAGNYHGDSEPVCRAIVTLASSTEDEITVLNGSGRQATTASITPPAFLLLLHFLLLLLLLLLLLIIIIIIIIISSSSSSSSIIIVNSTSNSSFSSSSSSTTTTIIIIIMG